MAVLGAPYLLNNLNAIVDILGTTSLSIWPFFEDTGSLVSGIAAVDLTSSDEAAARALEAEFAPYRHVGGLHSYHFAQSGNQHLAGTDDASHSFGNGTVDSAFSVGGLFLPFDITTVALIAKYDAGVGVAREWAWRIDASSKLSLELYDESADTTEIGASTASIAQGKWQFLVTTYDGGEAAPVVTHYIDGVADAQTGTTETGAYVAMENTATPLTIGCTGLTTLPAEEFKGRIALPFVTGKMLSATEVSDLHNLYRTLFGGSR